ncbi:MAG: O-antigen ligase family protein [Wenzhouxiangellaceae bacterium]|nr:O-antigen ligase family protein [Wenzhouxiangellaceae bacterium]
MAVPPEAAPTPRGSTPVPARSWLSRITALVLFSALALGLVVPKIAGAAFFLLALLGLIWLEPGLFRSRMVLAAHEKLLLLAVALFVGVWLAAWAGHGFDAVGRDDVGRILRLLLIIPIYLFLRRVDGIEWAWWWGMAGGAAIAGLYAIGFAIVGEPGQWADRVGGSTNPIYFGGIVLAFSLMLLPRLSDAELPVAARVALAIAMLLGLVASASSGSRGAWLALPPLLLLYVMTLGSRQQRAWRWGVPLAVLAVATLLAASSLVPLGERLVEAGPEVAALLAGESSEGTLGLRWQMWRLSFEALGSHWAWGGGPDAFHVLLDRALEQGRVDPALAGYEHPHNQFLSALLIAGVPGLLSLVLLLGLPVRRFARLWQTGLARTRMLGWCGLAAMTVLFVMCLSESIFQRNAGILWFGLLTAGSSALVQGRRRRELFERPPRRVHTISVTMICRDEADRIAEGLSSVAGWADEIIVLDSGSTDGTPDIAREYTDLVEVTDWPGFGIQKQRALDRATGDWVLSLDADEAVSDELRREIDLVLAREHPHFDGYCLPWSIRAFGGELQFGHWARAPMRLFRRGSASFTDAAVHEKPVFHDAGARIGQLEGPLYHDVFRDREHARRKLGDYARLQAEQRAAEGRRATRIGAALRAAVNFLDNFVLRAAFLDGRPGWIMSRLHARYTWEKYRRLAQRDFSDADGRDA